MHQCLNVAKSDQHFGQRQFGRICQKWPDARLAGSLAFYIDLYFNSTKPLMTYVQTGVECSGVQVEQLDHPWRSVAASECLPDTQQHQYKLNLLCCCDESSVTFWVRRIRITHSNKKHIIIWSTYAQCLVHHMYMTASLRVIQFLTKCSKIIWQDKKWQKFEQCC